MFCVCDFRVACFYVCAAFGFASVPYAPMPVLCPNTPKERIPLQVSVYQQNKHVLNSLCKLLSIRCLTCSKNTSHIFLKYKALILKYVPCVFARCLMFFLQCWEKSGKSPGFRLENGGVRRENAIAFTVAPLRFPEIGKRTLLSGCVFCLEGKGVHAHLLLHGQQAVAACGREVVAQSYLVNEIKIRVENFIGSMSRQTRMSSETIPLTMSASLSARKQRVPSSF